MKKYAKTEELQRLRDKGLTYAEIGKSVGITTQAVHYRLTYTYEKRRKKYLKYREVEKEYQKKVSKRI